MTFFDEKGNRETLTSDATATLPARTCETGDLWCATLAVGAFASNRYLQDKSALSTATINEDGTDYTVVRIDVGTSGV